MALRDVLEQYGVDVGDRAAVFGLLRRLPLSAAARLSWWTEYLQGRGERVTDGERAALSG